MLLGLFALLRFLFRLAFFFSLDFTLCLGRGQALFCLVPNLFGLPFSVLCLFFLHGCFTFGCFQALLFRSLLFLAGLLLLLGLCRYALGLCFSLMFLLIFALLLFGFLFCEPFTLSLLLLFFFLLRGLAWAVINHRGLNHSFL